MIHRLHGELDRQGAIRHDLARESLGGGDQILQRHNPICQPNAAGLLGVDRLATQNHLVSAAFAHETRQPLSSRVTGNNSQLDLGLSKARIFRRNA